ncbi:MAG: signal peptidase II [Gammaproteobacteria bacterium]|nr:signal peptidase II [Gammaproteobacteria bacterium]
MRWLWLSAVVVVLDQVTKAIASELLALYEAVPVLPGFNLTLMHNTGAAFSFLSDEGGWQRWFFAAVAVVVTAMLVLWLRRVPPGQRWLSIAIALVIGGALGNLWDRFMLGYVIDFIDVYAGRWHWPAFNVADSAITVGAAMLLFDAFRPQRQSP